MTREKFEAKRRTKRKATRSAYELIDAAGVIGYIKGGPKYLSTNKRYFSLNACDQVDLVAFRLAREFRGHGRFCAPGVHEFPDGGARSMFCSWSGCSRRSGAHLPDEAYNRGSISAPIIPGASFGTI